MEESAFLMFDLIIYALVIPLFYDFANLFSVKKQHVFYLSQIDIFHVSCFCFYLFVEKSRMKMKEKSEKKAKKRLKWKKPVDFL